MKNRKKADEMLKALLKVYPSHTLLKQLLVAIDNKRMNRESSYMINSFEVISSII